MSFPHGTGNVSSGVASGAGDEGVTVRGGGTVGVSGNDDLQPVVRNFIPARRPHQEGADPVVAARGETAFVLVLIK